MRYLLLAIALTSCVFTNRPIDVIGPGIYCQPLTEYRQRCWDRDQKPWICVVNGSAWDCSLEYPMQWGYTRW